MQRRGRQQHQYEQNYEYDPRREKIPSRVEMCVENAIVKTGLGFLGAGLSSFLFFRTRGARFTFAGFGAGMGAGIAYMDSRLTFTNPHVAVPSFSLLNMGYVKHQWNKLEDMMQQAYRYTANQIDLSENSDLSRRLESFEKTLKEQAYAAKEKASDLKHRYWDEDETGYAEVIKDKAIDLKDQAIQKASELKQTYWDDNEDAQDMVDQAKEKAYRMKQRYWDENEDTQDAMNKVSSKASQLKHKHRYLDNQGDNDRQVSRRNRDVESHGSQWKQRNFDNENEDANYNRDNYREFTQRGGRSSGMERGQEFDHQQEYDDHDDIDRYADQVKQKAVAMKDYAVGKGYEMKRKYVDSDYTDKMKDVGNEMKYKAKASMENMKSETSTDTSGSMKEGASDMIEKGKQKVKDVANKVKDKASSATSDVKKATDNNNTGDQAKDKSTSVKDQTSVKANETKQQEPKAHN